ncbi:MAG: plasmid stabilization protein [Acidobacteriota bacterium]
MADVLIRGLDDKILKRLKQRAARNGRSLQAELKAIVERGAMVDVIDARALAARIRERLGEQQSDSTELIAEDRLR